MANINKALLDNTFTFWVAAGRDVGALDSGRDYALQYGSASNGVSFQVLSFDLGTRDHCHGHSEFPYLGTTKASAYAVLSVMTAAWRLIPAGGTVTPVKALQPNEIEVTIYRAERLTNSSAGNPRWRLYTSEGNYDTGADVSVNYSVDNLTNSRFPDTYAIGDDAPPVILTLSKSAKVTHITKDGKKL